VIAESLVEALRRARARGRSGEPSAHRDGPRPRPQHAPKGLGTVLGVNAYRRTLRPWTGDRKDEREGEQALRATRRRHRREARTR
jgi:hypothetical protein